MSAAISRLGLLPAVLLIAFDCTAALGSAWLLTVWLWGDAFTFVAERDLAFFLVVGVAALALADRYGSFVVRDDAGIIRRASLAGIVYALAVAVTSAAVWSVVGVAGRFSSVSQALVTFAVMVIFASPFAGVLGLVFGSLHGTVAASFTRRSTRSVRPP